MLELVPTRPPRAHQKEALKKAYRKPAFFYLMEMGTGKSKVAVDEVLQLFLDGVIDRVLITAGKGSYADWVDKHLPENVPEQIPVLAHLWQGGNSTREKEGLSKLVRIPGNLLRVLVMNIESLGASKTAPTVAENFLRSGKSVVICDESTTIKNRRADRSEVMAHLGKFATYRRAMTGSPVTQSPMDLWGQMSFLGLQGVLGTNFYAFQARYAVMANTTLMIQKEVGGKLERKQKSVRRIVGYRNLERLPRLLEPYSYRVLKKDCLDLPPKIYQQRAVEMTTEQKRAYSTMSKLALAELADGLFATASNPMVRVGMLHRILSGVITDEGGTLHTIPTNRLAALSEVIDEMVGKIIIWATYRTDMEKIGAHLREIYPNDECVLYHGGIAPDIRRESLKKFQEGRARFFVGTQATGGVGITLTAASNVIYYNNNFSLEKRIQSEDRAHRDGQTQSVVYVDMVVPGTVDEKILKALKNKKDIANTTIGDDLTEWFSMPGDNR